MGIPWQQFMDMGGRANPGTNEKFSMSVFALNTAQETNGVSKLHGAVSQKNVPAGLERLLPPKSCM